MFSKDSENFRKLSVTEMADWKLQVRNLEDYSIPQAYCLCTEVKHHKKKYETLAHVIKKCN